MEIDEIKKRLRGLLSEHFGPATEQGVQDMDRLWKDPRELTMGDIDPEDGMDSLDKAEFAMLVEEEFQIRIGDSLLTEARTIQDFANLVQTLLPSPSANGG